MVYSTRRLVLCLTLCYFVLVFFSPFSIAITSLGEERANLSAFRTFVRFALVWFCLFPLSLGVWEGLLFVIVALAGLSSYLFLEGIVWVTCRLKYLKLFRSEVQDDQRGRHLENLYFDFFSWTEWLFGSKLGRKYRGNL